MTWYMKFHNVLNVITIIEKVNPHPRPKRAIVEMMLILTHEILGSSAIYNDLSCQGTMCEETFFP